MATVGAVTFCFAASAVTWRAQASTSVPTSYSAVVEGDGLQVNVVDANLPLVGPSVSLSPWAAGSQLDTIGDSVAFAGAPYLGSAVTPLYGTAQGLATNIGSNGIGEVVGIAQGIIPLPLPSINWPTLPISGVQLPGLPPLPGYAQSSYPVAPSQNVSAGAYNLSASSTASSNKANVLIGGSTGGGNGIGEVLASSSVAAEDNGGYSAEATAGVKGVTIGGVVDIADASSTMHYTASPSGPPVIHESSHLGSITVAGIAVGLTPNGIQVLGNTIETPAAATQLVDKILGTAGISMKLLPGQVSYVPGTRTIAGATSGSLLVSITKNVPDEGTVTVNLTLAQVSIGGPIQQFSSTDGGTGSSLSTGSGPSTGAATGSALSTASNPASTGITTETGTPGAITAGPAASASPPGSAGSNSSPVGSTSGSSPIASGPTASIIPASTARSGPSLAGIYLLLLLAGAFIAGGGLLIGQLAVRLRMRNLT